MHQWQSENSAFLCLLFPTVTIIIAVSQGTEKGCLIHQGENFMFVSCVWWIAIHFSVFRGPMYVTIIIINGSEKCKA